MTPEIILTAGIIVIAYAAMANRLFAFARSMREDFLSVAERVAVDPRVSPVHQQMIWNASVGISSAATAWRAVALLLAAIVNSAVQKLFGSAAPRARFDQVHIEDVPEDLQADYKRLVKVSVMASLCTSPAALLVFAGIIAVASFAGSGFRLAEQVASGLGSKKVGRNGDFCPPARPV